MVLTELGTRKNVNISTIETRRKRTPIYAPTNEAIPTQHPMFSTYLRIF